MQKNQSPQYHYCGLKWLITIILIQSLLKIKVIISICLIVNIFLCGEGNIVSTNCLLRITQINQIANCRFLQFITITGWFCGFHFRIAFKQIPHHKMLRSNIKCTIEKMLIYFRGSIGKCSYCFCNGFFDNTIAVWKYKNPSFLKLLYHKNTKTAIPLYQNCGFCLAEKERFEVPRRSHSRWASLRGLRSFTSLLCGFASAKSQCDFTSRPPPELSVAMKFKYTPMLLKEKRTSNDVLFFFCLKRDKRCLIMGKNEQKVSDFSLCRRSENWNLSFFL